MLDIRQLIYRQKKLITKNQCVYFIDFFEKHVDKSSAEVSTKYKVDGEIKREEDNYLSLNLSRLYNEPGFKEVADVAFSLISTMVLNYTQYLKINITAAIVSYYMQKTNNIRIMRYKIGQEIKDHLDISHSNRRASCTINLNSNYEGGEFSFFSGKHLLNLKEGEGIIFPAEQIWIHGVRPVTKGTRYSINCFLSPD
jgi:S-adenosylmethionine synthetase